MSALFSVLESLSCLPFAKSQLFTSVLENLSFAAANLLLESLTCLLFVAVYKLKSLSCLLFGI